MSRPLHMVASWGWVSRPESSWNESSGVNDIDLTRIGCRRRSATTLSSPFSRPATRMPPINAASGHGQCRLPPNPGPILVRP